MAGDDLGWVSVIRRSAPAIGLGAVALTMFSKVAFISPVAGFAVAESIRQCIDRAKIRGEDEVAKLKDELASDLVLEVAERLDILTDVPMTTDEPLAQQRRDNYETLCNVLADAYLLLAHAERDGLQNVPADLSLTSLREQLHNLCERESHLRSLPVSRTKTHDYLQIGVGGELGALGKVVGREGDRFKNLEHDRQEPTIPTVSPFPLDSEVEDTCAALIDTRNIGIVGMGGIGKTAVARAVFERAKAETAKPSERPFARTVWLTVGRNPSDADIGWLLEQAFHQVFDATKHSVPFVPEDAEKSLKILTQRVYDSCGSVLLVLDDVWLSRKLSVVAALNFATRPGCRHDESRLIVTTRQSSILSYGGLQPIDNLMMLPVRLLCEEWPWQLFEHVVEHKHMRAYAGQRPLPFEDDVRETLRQLVHACGGNASAIIYLGKEANLLFWKPTREQKLEALEALSRECSGAVDEASTHCSLSISKDVLPPSLRECFIAFAAFPSNTWVPEHVAMHLFATHSPLHTASTLKAAKQKLQELVQHSLLVAGVESGRPVYFMHPLLHRIALREGRLELTCTGRQACAHTRCFHAPANTQLDCCIRYFSMHADPELDAHPKLGAVLAQNDVAHKDITAAALLACIMSGIQAHSNAAAPLWPLRLRYLNLHGNLKIPAPDVNGGASANLQVLKFLCLAKSSAAGSIVQTILPAGQLVHLDLSQCSCLEGLAASVGRCTALTHLNLRGCSGLQNLPSEISCCCRLALVDMSECAQLTELPRLVADGGSGCCALTHLNLSWCNFTNLSGLKPIIDHCHSLACLQIAGCTALADLPGHIHRLTQLTHLDLSGCIRLDELPFPISCCTNLAHLDLGGCTALQAWQRNFDSTFSSCGSLAHVSLWGWSELKALPRHITTLRQLTYLDLSGCTSLATLPLRADVCCRLEHLNLSSCAALPRLSACMSQLVMHLNTDNCPNLQQAFETH